MFYRQATNKGLGPLEAYVEEQEGVALQMDNGMFWNSVEDEPEFPIQAADEKSYTSKFFVTGTETGKVALRDCRGWYLALKPVGTSPLIYPLHPTHKSPEETSEFRVFHKGNKVAFQAHNGLFLAKVFRGVFIVEAAKTTMDSSCFFRPQIGDLLAPDYKVLSVALGDAVKLNCTLCVLKKETYVNRGEEPVRHTFRFTWAEERVQTTIWTHPWGLGVATMAEFSILGTKASLKYNEENDLVVSVPHRIFETMAEEVEVPPRTKATAWLLVFKQDNVTVTFMAKIQKVKPKGTLQGFVEPGVWKGLVYYGLNLKVKVEPLGNSCETM